MRKFMTAYGTEGAYGVEGYYRNLELLKKSALEIGKVEEFVKYTNDDLKDCDYFVKNKGIIYRPFDKNSITTYCKIRNAQYWIWKPYIILETMKLMNDGDIIIYIDGGMIVIADLDPLYEITKTSKNNRLFISASQIYGRHLQSDYTKRDCFVLMGLDKPQYWNARMGNSALFVLMKTQKNIDLMTEWMNYMTDARVVTDDPNVCGLPNLPGHIEHRFDQSVLTLLGLKYNDDLYRDPSQYSVNEKFPNSPYGQLVIQHHKHLYA
jgi:hypothetical protein